MKMIVGICMLLCFAMVNPVYAEDLEFVKEGFYLGALFAYNQMSGDFDDKAAYTNEEGTWIYDAPEIDNGMGFGVVLGHRSKLGAAELGYQRTVHDTNSGFAAFGESEAVYNVIDLNFKLDVLAQDKLKPYLLLGFGVPWIDIEDASTDGVSYDDITYVGFNVNAGAGAAYYFHPQWAIMGGVIYRWNWFNEVEDGRIDDHILEKALGFTFGIAYTF